MDESLALARWDCTYHIVFIPKNGRKVLYGENRERIMRLVRNLLIKHKICVI